MGKFTKPRNKSIVLSEIGISPGDKLQFVPAAGIYTDIYVTVIDNQYIDYGGKKLTRAGFNKCYNKYQRQGTRTNEQQSTRYLYFNGRSLSEIWANYCNNGKILKPKKTIQNTEGYVYIFTNPAFKEGIYKCGFSKDYLNRKDKLFNTSVPYEWEVKAVIKVPNPKKVEEYFHKMMAIEEKRISDKREFFTGDVNKAVKHLHLIVQEFYPETGKIIV